MFLQFAYQIQRKGNKKWLTIECYCTNLVARYKGSKFHISALNSMEVGSSWTMILVKGEECLFSVRGRSLPKCKLFMIQLAGCIKHSNWKGDIKLKIEEKIRRHDHLNIYIYILSSYQSIWFYNGNNKY